MQTLSYSVPGVSCGQCRTAITGEVDLEHKVVTVTGTGVADAAVRDAIDEAGYDIA